MNNGSYETLIVNIDELWLKGRNRPFYFRTLKNNIQYLLKALGKDGVCISKDNHRFILNSPDPFSHDETAAVSKIAGVNAVIPAVRTGKDFGDILPAVLSELDNTDLSGISNFRISTKRVDKGFPLNSMEVSREIGSLVSERFPSLGVKMEDPDLNIEIRILAEGIYISSGKIPAPGGLPVGTNGHLVTMLSGGIDSPVASYLMSKRGCRQTFLFFYSYPMVGEDVIDKIKKLVSILAQYQSGSKLYVIRFGEFQKKLVKLCREEYRTLLFRKYMMECGALLAGKRGADAILTGDSLGQVSSQTIGNISEIDHFTDISIFRPLMGMNKAEIIAIAKEIGTFDTSVIPYDDACTMLAPRHPILRPERSYIERFLKENNLGDELISLIEEAEVFRADPAGRISPAVPTCVPK